MRSSPAISSCKSGKTGALRGSMPNSVAESHLFTVIYEKAGTCGEGKITGKEQVDKSGLSGR
jgi:hypothetical protein